MMSFWFLLLSVCLFLLTGSVGTLCFKNVRSNAKWLASAGASGAIVGLVLLGLVLDKGDNQIPRKLASLIEEICPSAEGTGTIKLSSSVPSRAGSTEVVVEEATLGQRVESARTEEVKARIRAELAKAEEVEAQERTKRAREDEEEAHRRTQIASREEHLARERAELAMAQEAEAQERAELARREEAEARRRADAARAEEMEARTQAEVAKAAELESRKRADSIKAENEVTSRKPPTAVIIRAGRKSLAVWPTQAR